MQKIVWLVPDNATSEVTVFNMDSNHLLENATSRGCVSVGKLQVQKQAEKECGQLAFSTWFGLDVQHVHTERKKPDGIMTGQTQKG